ncbi:phosphodiesterase [Wenxinia saemankumensis]|uniref:3',5'-cyclic AMP phosphodiesterase CpdA n=1 Tax=Wenxinia saemankumensis TaxID=1447782 RepID=A0A1M6GRY1_9RHOB|nr:phosphodiesterase [Wenxinia saemankumensis]SHJ12700.1 3',5'-cyclic AMP phosphodiesterase CpdA [Wenxinia saemankumensis]
MTKLLVMSDLHVTPEGARIIGLDPLERLRATLDHAMSRHGDADLLVLCGDLAHRGDAESYARLAALLDPLPLPVVTMLGNHDRRGPFRAAFPGAPDAGGFVQSRRDAGDWRLIFLDSLDEGSAAGRLCDERLAWLDGALADPDGRRPLVFVHHPPADCGLPGMDAIRLAEGEALLDRLAPLGGHLVCGHVHRTASGSARGVPWAMLKSPCHQAPLDFETADSSLSIDEPPGYGVILLRPGRVVIHHEDVLAKGWTGPVGRD